MKNAEMVRYGLKSGGLLGLGYVVNVQILTWMGLGLTSWVLRVDLALMVVAVVALHRSSYGRGGTLYGRVDCLVGLLLLTLTAGLIRQIYMVVYILAIDPGWVDMVVGIRSDLLAAGGASAEQIERRMVAVRGGFTPVRMFTIGVLLPALWKLAFASLLTVALRARLAGTRSPST